MNRLPMDNKVLKKEEIIQVCSNNFISLESVIKNINYENHGIINSEMLLFCSIVKYLDVNLIIESGRAKGYSTQIIAEFFRDQNKKIYSIEYNRYHRDVKHSFEKLKRSFYVKLLFGNSFNLIPDLITEECCILIDSPKDLDSIELAINSLKNPLVKAVFIHDLYKDSLCRGIAEKVFKYHFFTDNLQYVSKFRNLDVKCWNSKRYIREFLLPYRRGKIKMKSYAFTLMVIFNNKNPCNNELYQSYLKNIAYKKNGRSFSSKLIWLKTFLREEFLNKVRIALKFPMYYKYYEKRINNRVQLNILDMISKWKAALVT